MKKYLLIVSAFALAISNLGSIAQAHEGKDKNPSCVKIKEACKSAGYVKGGHKEDNKGLWKDCIGPIMKDGKKIEGVSGYTDEDVAACKAAHKGKHKGKKHDKDKADDSAVK